jgi:phosphoribosylglycinamide formyltransferase 1
MRVGVLVSGRGTNLQALLDAERTGRLAPATVEVIVSSRPGAPALERAAAAGKATEVVDAAAHAGRDAFEAALGEALEARRVEALVLAGFMRILSEGFLARWPDRVLNVHPSLLPAFPGLHAQRQALEHGAKVAGCTVHLVSAEVDGGAIVLQACVPVAEDDDVAALSARILEREHELLPRAVQLLASGRLAREGRRVRIRP